MRHDNIEDSHYRYFMYLRKSINDEDRQIRSIPDQLIELRELARKEELEVVDVLEERQSAKVKGRPVFNEMLRRIEAGEADGIIAWHPDRLARNAFDGGQIIDLIDEGKIRDLRFCTFTFENTAQGKFILVWSFGQSKYFVDKLSDDVRRAQRRKVAEGVWAWKAPVGYLNEPKLRTIVPDPKMAPLVTRAFESYSTGRYSVLQLWEMMKEAGLQTDCNGKKGGTKKYKVSLNGFYHMLTNTFYYGPFCLHGEMFEGSHQPLITKDLFDKCQAMMRQRSKQNSPRLKTYVYRGLLHCRTCGCTITMETQKGHNYLRCTKKSRTVECTEPYMREEMLSTQISQVLTSVSLPDDWADWMLRQVETRQTTGNNSAAEARRKTMKSVAAIDAKIYRLTTGYLEAGAFTPAEFRQLKEPLIIQKRELLDKVAQLEKGAKTRLEPLTRFIIGCKQMKYVAARSVPSELRAEMGKVGSNLQIHNKQLVFTPRGAWKLLVNQGSFAQRNTASSCDDAVTGGEIHLIPSKCPWWESNPHDHYWSTDFKSVASAFPPQGPSLMRVTAGNPFHKPPKRAARGAEHHHCLSRVVRFSMPATQPGHWPDQQNRSGHNAL